MKSNVRNKSKKKKSEQPRACLRVLVEDLRHGDRIATVFTDDPITGARLALSSKKVEQITECPSQWRTHIHVNKMECHDMRTHVWVVL